MQPANETPSNPETQPRTVAWYDANAARLAPTYEAVAPLITRDWLAPLLPKPPAVVIDIGAGTGRDAAGFADAGFEVIAVEPSSGMRAQATSLHPQSRIRWVADSLPSLPATLRAGVAADVVCLVPSGSTCHQAIDAGLSGSSPASCGRVGFLS
jgi:SAM-dependent methyltransferase